MSIQNRITRKSKGQFNQHDWISEGDGLLASSSKIREIWEEHRKRVLERSRLQNSRNRPTVEDWALLKGLPRTSMLLLGYAAEMFLKAGLTKAYRECADSMFERDVRSRFGHQLESMAVELSFPSHRHDYRNLHVLQDMILFDARYPVHISDSNSYADAANKRTSKIWSEENYAELYSLVNRVRDHISKIDNDSSNPAEFLRYEIDGDGYCAFRLGGHLPPRITYRLSNELRHKNKLTASDIKQLFDQNEHGRILQHWEHSWIFEDGQDSQGRPKTLVHQRPK